MYIVVDRARGEVGVLDTSTMNVFKSSIGVARDVYMASGASLNNGIYFSYIMKWNKDRRLVYNNIKVFCPDINIDMDDTKYKNCAFCSLLDDYIETVKLSSPMSYLMCYGLLLRSLSTDNFSVIVAGKSYKIPQSDYESMILFCLYGIYNKVDVVVMYASEIISPDFNFIKSNIICFEYGSDIYFCDNTCTVVVSSKVIKGVANVSKRFVKNAKYRTLNNSLVSSIASDDVIVMNGYHVVLNERKKYIFGAGNTRINVLEVHMKDDMEIVFNGTLDVDTFIYRGSKSGIDDFNAHLKVRYVRSYNINKDAFDFTYFLDNFILKKTQAQLFILDFSDEDWRQLIVKVAGASLLRTIKSRSQIIGSNMMLRALNLYNTIRGNNISPEILCMVDVRDYDLLGESEFLSEMSVSDSILSSLASRYFIGHSFDVYYVHDARRKNYESIYQKLSARMDEIKELERLTGCGLKWVRRGEFFVDYRSEFFPDDTVYVSTLDEYNKAQEFERDAKNAIEFLENKYSVKIKVKLKQHSIDFSKLTLMVLDIEPNIPLICKAVKDFLVKSGVVFRFLVREV